LLGLLGGVVLHVTVKSPVITSLFLATGVASLVYRFLGGTEGATFVWGAIKMGGSLAALVGVAVVLIHYLEIESIVSAPVQGTYEWQWAGQGWIGYVDVAKNATARIAMSKHVTCNGADTQLPVLEQKPNENGKAVLIDNGRKLQITIPIHFIRYDGCNRTGLDEVTVLTGTLARVPAYAGSIGYESKYATHRGDMILVGNFISGVHQL